VPANAPHPGESQRLDKVLDAAGGIKTPPAEPQQRFHGLRKSLALQEFGLGATEPPSCHGPLCIGEPIHLITDDNANALSTPGDKGSQLHRTLSRLVILSQFPKA
jgi:hypothetical protein